MLLICDEAREVRDFSVEFILVVIVKGVEFIIGILSASHLLPLHDHLGLQGLILQENILASQPVVIDHVSEILDDAV
jgi:hypothetical protein